MVQSIWGTERGNVKVGMASRTGRPQGSRVLFIGSWDPLRMGAIQPAFVGPRPRMTPGFWSYSHLGVSDTIWKVRVAARNLSLRPGSPRAAAPATGGCRGLCALPAESGVGAP